MGSDFTVEGDEVSTSLCPFLPRDRCPGVNALTYLVSVVLNVVMIEPVLNQPRTVDWNTDLNPSRVLVDKLLQAGAAGGAVTVNKSAGNQGFQSV